MKSLIPGKLQIAMLTLALGVMGTGVWAAPTRVTNGGVDIQGASCGGSDTLGAMFCNVHQSSVAQIILLVMGLAFLGGLFLFWKGLSQLIKIADNSNAGSIGSAMLPLAGGSFLVALPATIAVGLGTLGAGTNWGFRSAATVGDGGELEADSFLSMVGNFAINAAGPLSTLVMGIAVLIGIVLVVNSMFGLAKIGDPQSRPEGFGPTATKFLVGILLINIFWIMDAIGASFGLKGMSSGELTSITQNALSYAGLAQAENITLEERFNYIVDIAFMALIPFGLIAFVRGLLIVKDSTDGSKQASLGAAATHIVGGIALVNAHPVSCAIMKTLAGGAAFCPGTGS